MKVLIVFAHPEPRSQSLNHSLLKVAINELEKLGHEVKTSDLYAMNWKSNLDADDFPLFDKKHDRLKVNPESARAFKEGKLTDAVLEEQAKLKWADFLILQFPLWWYTIPAIMKGWVERVFSYGFAYAVNISKDKPHGDRYGEGLFQGKRAMLLVTIGGPETGYSETGINGDIFDILFPIQHGILFTPGYQVLEPYIIWRANRFPEESFPKAADDLRQRLRDLETDEPIAFRLQNGGDYDKRTLVMKPEAFDPKVRGLRIHVKK
ncbi:unnamed protein product [Ambrosiozyma monospora]|uniref:Unnamed protein product n=1 Tax=Ambrosiozyma monospora TaxID=43982 RepID=A0ACB5TUE3_AMBMO|nr:unnamed protein product [Ambrosiozyma monospora]